MRFRIGSNGCVHRIDLPRPEQLTVASTLLMFMIMSIPAKRSSMRAMVWMLVFAGCDGSGPVAVAHADYRGPATTTFAFGEVEAYHGEYYPTGPFQAYIQPGSPYTGFVDVECSSGSFSCSSMNLRSAHLGLWNGSERIVHWSANGNAGASYTDDSDGCVAWDPGYPAGSVCSLKKSVDELPMSAACGTVYQANTTHKAWWMGIAGISTATGQVTVSFSAFRIGEKTAASTAAQITTPPCPTGGGGSGGSGGGGSAVQICYSAFLVWRDESGAIIYEQYLGEWCFDEYET